MNKHNLKIAREALKQIAYMALAEHLRCGLSNETVRKLGAIAHRAYKTTERVTEEN
jgi:hypothetical protein